MAHLIDKDALVAEIERLKSIEKNRYAYITMEDAWIGARNFIVNSLISFLDTLEVKDPYEQLIQYPSRELAIKAHAEDYSWNIDSELFQQLTPEQQKLWRKEIEQAVISGGEVGVELSRDPRYKENLEVKEVGISVPIIDDTLKEVGLDPDSKEAKIIKESYFMAIEKLTQKGE